MLLFEQLSLSDYLYFLRYLDKIFIVIFVNQVVTSKILNLNLDFLSSGFSTLSNWSEKTKYLKNKKSF